MDIRQLKDEVADEARRAAISKAYRIVALDTGLPVDQLKIAIAIGQMTSGAIVDSTDRHVRMLDLKERVSEAISEMATHVAEEVRHRPKRKAKAKRRARA